MCVTFSFNSPRICHDIKTASWYPHYGGVVPRAAGRMMLWRGFACHQMHDTVAWDRPHATSIWGNGGLPRHTTITTQRWRKIGGVAILRQQWQNRKAPLMG
jgi:hypothetical protein